MHNQSDRGVQSILIQPIAATSDTDETIQLDQQNCPEDNEASASAATELVMDSEAVLFRPRLSFVSED
jgi:hypothetical protein